MAVYVDLAAVLNFLVDFFLMLGTNRLAGFPAQWQRLLPAAALGGIYSALSLAFPALGGMAGRLAVLAFMSVLAFGTDGSALRRGAVFLLLSLALGGMATGFHEARFSLLLLEAVLLAALCQLAFGERIGSREYVSVSLSFRGRTLKLTALRDTGNSLKDPITGLSVLVISPRCAARLTGLTQAQLADPASALCSGTVPGLRLIPCSTAGGSGMLLALKPDDLEIEGRPAQALVAIARQELGTGTPYQALTGGNL